jgi:hypothetical protein
LNLRLASLLLIILAWLKMTIKISGVSREDVQKLRQLQVLLMKRKFGSKAFNKMEFIQYVQLKSELIQVPQVRRISVANNNIYLDDGAAQL